MRAPADPTAHRLPLGPRWERLADAVSWLGERGSLHGQPLVGSVSAVSVGAVAGEPRLDLCYDEDVTADTGMNVVVNGTGDYVEVQGTAERRAFDRRALDALLDLAVTGCADLAGVQRAALAQPRPGPRPLPTRPAGM